MLHIPEESSYPKGKGLCLPLALASLTEQSTDSAVVQLGYHHPRLNWNTILDGMPQHAVLLHIGRASDVAAKWVARGNTTEKIPRKGLRWHIETGTITRGVIVTKHRNTQNCPVDHAIAIDDPLVSDNGTLILAREYWRRQVKYAWVW